MGENRWRDYKLENAKIKKKNNKKIE